MGSEMVEFALAVALGLGGLLLASGVAKLRTGRFTADLANYRLLPTAAVLPAARLLPWVEVTLGAALLGSPWPEPPLIGAAVLLALFTLGIVVNLLRGRRIPCGCRGAGKPISWRLAGTNVAWMVAAAIAANSAPSPILTIAEVEPAVSAADGVAVLACVLLVAVMVRTLAVAAETRAVVARAVTMSSGGSGA